MYLRALSSIGLLRLRASQLGRVLLLALLALAPLDRAGLLDSGRPQVWAVTLLARRVDDLGVDATRAGVGSEGRGLRALRGLVVLARLLGQELKWTKGD